MKFNQNLFSNLEDVFKGLHGPTNEQIDMVKSSPPPHLNLEFSLWVCKMNIGSFEFIFCRCYNKKTTAHI